jgi:ubiquinone/menaquinone biosynthesis C-methylase UbiE
LAKEDAVYSRIYANTPTDMGEQYEQGMVPIVFAPWAVVLIEHAQPKPGERILDVACGTGVVARLAAARVGPSGTVAGADISAAMIAAARRASDGIRVDWREADATALPFADTSFDLVLCQQGLQFFPDRVAALREMRRVLAPDGRLGLAVFGPQEESPGYHAVGQVLARYVGPQAGRLPPFALGDADSLRGLVAEADYQEIEIRRETLFVRCSSAAEFLNRLIAGAPTIGAALNALHENEQRSLVGDFEAAVADYVGDDGFVFPMMSNLVIARP